MKKIILLILLGIVFLLSNENAVESNVRSYSFLEGSVGQVYNLESVNRDALNYGVRKLAHFSIYFFIGLATIFYIDDKKLKNTNKLWLCLLLVLGFAFFDEVHQIYTGRHFSYVDILIDFSGGILAIVLYYQLRIKRRYSIRP